jgi:hypothetical protein
MKQPRNRRPTIRPLDLPDALLRLGPALIDEQMWCLGCDVRHPAGNLLCAYGLERRPSPEPRFHSAYTQVDADGRSITLWGWGIWVAAPDHGSLFISRDRLRLAWTPHVEPVPQAWTADDLPLPAAPSADGADRSVRALLRDALRWIAGYERWLRDHIGPEYRARTIDAWPQRRRYRGGVPADALAETWLMLADALAA